MPRNSATQAHEIAETVSRAQNLVHRDKAPELTGAEQMTAIETFVQIGKNGATINVEANQLAAKLGLPKILALPRVEIPADMWEDSSDEQDRSRLTASITVCGVSMHVEALEATFSDDLQEFTGSQGDMADDVYEAVGGSGHWQTAKIDGRDYAIIITPYCN